MTFCPIEYQTEWGDTRHWAVWLNSRKRALPLELHMARVPGYVGLQLAVVAEARIWA